MKKAVAALSLACAVVFLQASVSLAQGVSVTPGKVGGTPLPGAPSTPHNPNQTTQGPSGAGVNVTIPGNQGPTRVRCTRNGREVPC